MHDCYSNYLNLHWYWLKKKNYIVIVYFKFSFFFFLISSLRILKIKKECEWWLLCTKNKKQLKKETEKIDILIKCSVNR